MYPQVPSGGRDGRGSAGKDARDAGGGLCGARHGMLSRVSEAGGRSHLAFHVEGWRCFPGKAAAAKIVEDGCRRGGRPLCGFSFFKWGRGSEGGRKEGCVFVVAFGVGECV